MEDKIFPLFQGLENLNYLSICIMSQKVFDSY